MLVVDVAVGIAILGILTIGASYLAALRKRQRNNDPNAQVEDAREKGARNVQRMEAKDALRCTMCNRDTSIEGTLEDYIRTGPHIPGARRRVISIDAPLFLRTAQVSTGLSPLIQFTMLSSAGPSRRSV